MKDPQILIDALRLIRDDRCQCGGRFKWDANQLQCEQCKSLPGKQHARAIATDALINYEKDNK